MSALDFQSCTPEERSNSASSHPSVHCLTGNERTALAFAAQSGALSLFACVLAFGLIIRNIRHHSRLMPGKWRLIKIPMDIYLLSLFLAELFAAIGTVVDARWVSLGKSSIGNWCLVQSIFLTLGDINIACTTLAIAVHTFVMVWCDKGHEALKVAWFAISIPWIYSVIYIAIVASIHRTGPDAIFRLSPYWCWVGKGYLVHRLFAGYLWMWIALFFSFILYVPIFFWGRGNITIGDNFRNFQIHRRRQIDDRDDLRRHALIMILYPVFYGMQILPFSVVRWIGFVQENTGDRINRVPSKVSISVHMIYHLSGVVNIVLFLTTRRNLLLFGNPVSTDQLNRHSTDSIAGNNGDIDDVNRRNERDSIEGHDDRREYSIS